MAHTVLSAEQVASFRNDGFLVVPRMFAGEEARRLQAWTSEVSAWPETPGRHMMYFEKSRTEPGKRLLNRLENFAPYHAGFGKMMMSERLAGAVSDLFGEPAVLFKDKINFKFPGGGGFTPHQDVQAGWDVYGSIHITAMVSIDACTLENGCLEMVRGRHRSGLIGQSWAPLDEAAMTGMTFEPVVTKPGDAVFFDSFAPHRSEPNNSDQPRRVLYVTYGKSSEGDVRERYYADKRRSYPQDCEREVGKEYVFRV